MHRIGGGSLRKRLGRLLGLQFPPSKVTRRAAPSRPDHLRMSFLATLAPMCRADRVMGAQEPTPSGIRVILLEAKAPRLEPMNAFSGHREKQKKLCVENDEGIAAPPWDRADDALGEGILPGRSRGDEDLANPQGVH